MRMATNISVNQIAETSQELLKVTIFMQSNLFLPIATGQLCHLPRCDGIQPMSQQGIAPSPVAVGILLLCTT